MDITLNQIDSMKHCIGFRGDKVKRRKYVVWRNYYTTSFNDPSWDMLVDLGYAIKRNFPLGIGEDPKLYSVSESGLRLLEGVLECKIVEDKT